VNNLARIRKEKGISQLKLSFLASIAPSEISRIENNKLVAFPGWRKRFAEALGVTEAELFPDGEKARIQ
jgi:transcriptional regulator with XRE-family HTH domain